MSGPNTVSASKGSPHTDRSASAASASTRSSCIPASTSTRVAAVQSWPALKYAAPATASAVVATSASANTSTGALPPSSRWTRHSRSAAIVATCRPARGLPVRLTMATDRWRTRAWPVAAPPHTTFSTPGGNTSHSSSAIRTVEAGVSSEGFEHHGVPGGQGRGPLPHGHHQGIVPRGDLAAHPHRLTADARRDPLQVLARGQSAEQPGRPGEEADLVDGGGQLVLQRGRVRLAGVGDLEPGEFVGVVLEHLGRLPTAPAAVGRGGQPPRLERRRRGRTGPGHLGGVGVGGRGVHLTGGPGR